jgi:hypothetical protein
LRADGRVGGAVNIVEEPLEPNGGVAVSGAVVIKALKTEGRIPNTACQTKERIIALRRVPADVTSVRWRTDCLRC